MISSIEVLFMGTSGLSANDFLVITTIRFSVTQLLFGFRETLVTKIAFTKNTHMYRSIKHTLEEPCLTGPNVCSSDFLLLAKIAKTQVF